MTDRQDDQELALIAEEKAQKAAWQQTGSPDNLDGFCAVMAAIGQISSPHTL